MKKMGYRLYYAATYHIELGGGYFNHKTEINRLLVDECDASYNEITPECSDHLEVQRKYLAKLVQDIKDNPDEYRKYIESKGWKYTPEDLADIFEEIIAKSDPKNDYIVLIWN